MPISRPRRVPSDPVGGPSIAVQPPPTNKVLPLTELAALALPPSGRLMPIFVPIVPRSPALVQAFEPESASRCAV
jgi:hypothetical protein